MEAFVMASEPLMLNAMELPPLLEGLIRPSQDKQR